jgi:hypothetical protein
MVRYLIAFAAMFTLLGCHRAETTLPVINGSCRQALPIGDPSLYRILLRTKDPQGSPINIRSTPNWMSDTANILGTIPAGSLLEGVGPLKDAQGSTGIGYAVMVRDPAGLTGRGYVSLSVVDVVSQ